MPFSVKKRRWYKNRIIVADGRLQKAFRIGRGGGQYNLKTRPVPEVTYLGTGVRITAATVSINGRHVGDGDGKPLGTPLPGRPQPGDKDFIHCGGHKIDRHKINDGVHPGHRRAGAPGGQHGFLDACLTNTVPSELFPHFFRGAVNGAGIGLHGLTGKIDPLVPPHFLRQCVLDGSIKLNFWHFRFLLLHSPG
jgi:hypothetical protein